jgi:Acyl-coenzyme A:6-aminopenicillanic acid acyl-transferase
MKKLKALVLVVAWLFSIITYAQLEKNNNVLNWTSPSGYVHSEVLEGTWYEIGKKAADLSNLKYEDTMMYRMNEYYSGYFFKATDSKLLANIASYVYDIRVTNRMIKRISPEDREYLRGMAASFGVKPVEIERAFISPDGLHSIATDGLKLINFANNLTKKEKNYRTKFISRLSACSSFSAFNERTVDGKRVFGRNLDYIGLGVFDKASAVYLVKPKDGYKYLSVGPKGLPSPGISGMNEHGLVLSTHSVLTKKYNISKSAPVLSVNRIVLEKAKTIEEAMEIYSKNPVFTGWMIHISDRHPVTNAPRSAVIELNPEGNTIVWSEDNYLVLSNHYLSEIQKKREPYTFEGYRIHNEDRYKRLKHLVKESVIDLTRSAEILRDSHSPYSNSKVDFSPSSIIVPNQVNSIIFYPDSKKLYMSEGPAPSSVRGYYEFSFEQLEQKLPPNYISYLAVGVSDAFDAYMQAYHELGYGNDTIAAENHLKKAHDLSTDCSYDLVYGSVLVSNSKLDQGLEILKKARTCAHYNPQQLAISNFLIGLIEQYKGNILVSDEYYEYALLLTTSDALKKQIAVLIKQLKLDINEVKELADIDIEYMDTLW